jgi:hypothetical protein
MASSTGKTEKRSNDLTGHEGGGIVALSKEAGEDGWGGAGIVVEPVVVFVTDVPMLHQHPRHLY